MNCQITMVLNIILMKTTRYSPACAIPNNRYFTKLPWCVKPFFAFISDRYYLFGFRTKWYFVITGILELVCFILLGFEIRNTLIVTVLIFVEQVSLAFRDSLAEGLMVILTKTEKRNQQRRLQEFQRRRAERQERRANAAENEENQVNEESEEEGTEGQNEEEQPLNRGNTDVANQAPGQEEEEEQFNEEVINNSQKYVTIIFNVRFIGSFFTSYLAGLLLMYITPHQLLFACMVMPLVTIVHALFFFDEPVQELSEDEKQKLQDFSVIEVWNTVKEKKWEPYIGFFVILLAWPNTINGLRYFLIDHLGFTTMDIGMIFTISSVFYIIYMFLLSNVCSNYSMRGYYKFVHLLMVIDIVFRYCQMLPVFYPSGYAIAIGDQTINNLFYDLPSIPLLAIICDICPEGKEATYYAFFVSLSNFFCSLANFTGYMYLKALDVTSEDYTYLCVILLDGSVLSTKLQA